MSQPEDLLSKISRDLNIRKGDIEKEDDWAGRVVWSACLAQAGAVLWDASPEAARERFRARFAEMAETFASLMPNSVRAGSFSRESGELADEILRLWSTAGLVWQSSDKFQPSLPRGAETRTLLLVRGISPRRGLKMSGCGFYLDRETGGSLDVLHIPVEEMFQLPELPLKKTWYRLTGQVRWGNAPPVQRLEYLRYTMRGGKISWSAGPDTSVDISLTRSKSSGTRQYGLYRDPAGFMRTADLPAWCCWSREYGDEEIQTVIDACLAAHSALPPIRYAPDGSVVHFSIRSSMSPPVAWLLRLYSWPSRYGFLCSDPERVMTSELFDEIRVVLERLGFTFSQVQQNA